MLRRGSSLSWRRVLSEPQDGYCYKPTLFVLTNFTLGLSENLNLSSMSFGVIVVAIIFIGLIIYNVNRENKSFSNTNSSTGVKRVTMDSIQPKTSNKMVFYGRIKKQIINCEYKNQNFRCDIIINIDVDAQTVSCMEIGFMKKFKSIKRRFNAQSKFVELSEIGTNATYYLKLHRKNNSLFSVELTNSDDTGFIYFSDSIFHQNT